MSTSITSYSRPSSFFPSLQSSHLGEHSPLEKNNAFVDVMKSSHSVQTAFPLKKQPTKEQALDAAKDVMQAFYTQFLKMMFENLKEDDDENPYQSEMMHGLLAENLSKTLGQKMTPTHTKIAEVMLKNGARHDDSQNPLHTYTTSPSSSFHVST